MARRIEEDLETVTITFEDQKIEAQAGDSVAAALTAAGLRSFRESVVSGAPRGIYCMMGTCFDCLVDVDGVPNQQACQVRVREGMQVRRQQGGPSVEVSQ